MLQLGNIAALNKIKSTCALFLEAIVIELFSRRAADDDMSECFEQRSKSDKFINAIVLRVLSKPVSTWPVGGLNMQHVDATIDESCMTHLYAETENANRTKAPLHPERLSSEAREKSKNLLTCQESKQRASIKEKCLLRRSLSLKSSKSSRSSSSTTKSP